MMCYWHTKKLGTNSKTKSLLFTVFLQMRKTFVTKIIIQTNINQLVKIIIAIS